MPARVVIALSGGVDSAVAALLLKREGHEVIGVHMHLWCEERDGKGAQRRPCCSVEDARDAQAVCRKLGIPFYILNFESEFQDHVVDYFCREYALGRTPNPCLACNERLKFGFLLSRALSLGAQYLATGHYAHVIHPAEGWRLIKGVDPMKDQSYFLYMLGQAELAHLLFPVGVLTKTEVRRLAVENGLPVARKPDSMEVCFVPDGGYRGFVSARVAMSPGDIVDVAGNILGRHSGLVGYTVGQRHGLGLSGASPLYVTGLDAAANRLVVGPEEQLYASSLVAGAVRWVAGNAPESPVQAVVKIRYRAEGCAAVVVPGAGSAQVHFAMPQRAVAPGQAVVFYQGEEVLGGGIIERVADHGKKGVAYAGGRTSASCGGT
ncbi:MAG: tRNA 2-thiouridine(34) synthase MnmA [Chloroflexi bacterium]|nr:tRNA 2-thiouridine(34) synthase MnmA [Chloroflexota bacterium]